MVVARLLVCDILLTCMSKGKTLHIYPSWFCEKHYSVQSLPSVLAMHMVELVAFKEEKKSAESYAPILEMISEILVKLKFRKNGSRGVAWWGGGGWLPQVPNGSGRQIIPDLTNHH